MEPSRVSSIVTRGVYHTTHFLRDSLQLHSVLQLPISRTTRSLLRYLPTGLNTPGFGSREGMGMRREVFEEDERGKCRNDIV